MAKKPKTEKETPVEEQPQQPAQPAETPATETTTGNPPEAQTPPPVESAPEALPADTVTPPVEPVPSTATPINIGDLVSGNLPPQPAPAPPAEPSAVPPVEVTPTPQPPTEPPKPKNLGGRPVGSRNKPKFNDVVTDGADVNYPAMSEALFVMSTSSLSTIFGPEWQPRDEQEKKWVVECLAVYLKSKQTKDIPPGLMLSIVLLSYSAPRLKSPNTATKLKLAWLWIKDKFRKRTRSPREGD